MIVRAFLLTFVLHLSQSCKVHRAQSGTAVEVLFIKVGKTGSSTVEKFLDDTNVSCALVHVRRVTKADLASSDRVLISTRDPVERLISAHKYSNPTGGGERIITSRSKNNIRGQIRIAFYECFPTATAFAQAFVSSSALDGGDRLSRSLPADFDLHRLSALDSPSERARKCRWLAEEAVEPRQEPMLKHISQGYGYYLHSALPILASKQLFLTRNGHGDSLSRDLLDLGRWLNRSLPVTRIVHYGRNYTKQGERVTDLGALAALRARLQFEYRILAQLESIVQAQRQQPGHV